MMKEECDYISYHGKVTNIRDNVDKDYIYFDIGQFEFFIDNNGNNRVRPTYFSARVIKKINKYLKMSLNMDVIVKGIPKAYVDKKGYRQNYIHITEINNIAIKDIMEEKYYTDKEGNEYWNGKLIPEPESWDMNNPEQKALSDWLDSFS